VIVDSELTRLLWQLREHLRRIWPDSTLQYAPDRALAASALTFFTSASENPGTRARALEALRDWRS
jgi:hypothetical protein